MLKIIHILILKKEVNDKDPKFKVDDHVRTSKFKKSEEVFLIKKVKNTVLWIYVINDLNGEEVIGTFYEKELQKTNQQKFRIEKVIKRKGDKLYVKWKGFDSSFNSWIDKKKLAWFYCITDESVFSKTVWTIWWRY